MPDLLLCNLILKPIENTQILTIISKKFPKTRIKPKTFLLKDQITQAQKKIKKYQNHRNNYFGEKGKKSLSYQELI